MILLLYANLNEVKYIDYEPKYIIGLGATALPPMDILHEADGVVLFGSCGLLNEYYVDACNICDYPQDCFDCEYRVKYNQFLIPRRWINSLGETIECDDLLKVKMGGIGLTWPGSVRSKYLTDYVKDRFPQTICVDQESYIVGKYCKDRDIPFESVRYIIDRCNRRVMLPAFNHFWRRRQHAKMQRKFNELIIQS